MTEPVEWCSVVWQIVGDSSSSGSTGWMTFGVALLTGASSVVGIVVGQKNQARSEAKSVRAALLAEVAAISGLLKSNDFMSSLKQCSAKLRTFKNVFEQKAINFEVATAEHLNIIYRANLAKLGGLSEDEATSIVRFHYLLEGFFVDITTGGALARGTRDYRDFDKASQMLQDILDISDALTHKRSPWWRRCGQNVDAGKAKPAHGGEG